METQRKAELQVRVDWEHVARGVLRSRLLDDLEEAELAPTGEVPYQFSARGHELAQVLLAQHLTHPHDAATVYYRSRPFMLACGLTLAEALAADMGRTGSPSEGRDVGVVFSMPHRGGSPTVLPASGDVGGQYTPAAGWAQAILYRRDVLAESDWSGAIAVALGGDGSVATNGFWSALTMATTLRLPMLFFIEDNAYGLSVPSSLQTPGGDIAANLLHHLNNKVGTIPVRIQGIRDKCQPALLADPYLASNLTEIERSASESMQTVRENLSHLHPIYLVPVSVAACVLQAVETAHLPSGMEVRTEGLDNLPPVAAAERNLVLVFTNLLENASNAMSGEGVVTITGAVRQTGVEIAVSDSGPGIPPELHDRIFEFYYSNRGKARPGKLGFGLWWVKTVMRRLGGSVSVESDGVHGATFRLLLPEVEASE